MVACGDPGKAAKEAPATQEEMQNADSTDQGEAAPQDTLMEVEPTPMATPEEVSALYSAVSQGRSIKLKHKIYYLNGPLRIANKSDFTLDGDSCTFYQKDPAADVIIVESSNGIVLKNFKATHIEPTGPLGCTGNVIQVYGSNRVTVEGCQLNGSGIIGVTAYSSKDLNVKNNFIFNNSRYGILYDKDCTIEIANNRFTDNGPGGNDHVVKALNPVLSEIEAITADENKEGLRMAGNSFD